MDISELEYVGFWLRVWAAIIDTVLVSVLVSVLVLPILTWVYGRHYWSGESLLQGPVDLLVSWVLPAVAVLAFWIARQATPGKMAISARVVDARTGGPASTGQLIGRYLGYFVSTFPFMLGLFWVGLDARKQGWHDKLAGTVVVRRKTGGTEAVKFEGG